MEDLNRKNHLARLVDEFKMHVGRRDFIRIIEVCEDIHRLKIDDPHILQFFSLIWNNWIPVGGFSSETLQKRREFLEVKRKDRSSKCLEYIFQEIAFNKFSQTFDYLASIIELPPYCHDTYLNGYFALMSYHAYNCPDSMSNGKNTAALVSEKQRSVWAKTALKHFELAKHCNVVFDYHWCKLMHQLELVEEAISLLNETLNPTNWQNVYLLELLFEIGTEEDKFKVAKELSQLNTNLNSLDLIKYLDNLSVVLFLIQRIELENQIDLWNILKQALLHLTPDDKTNLVEGINLDFVLETWNALINMSSISNLHVNIIENCIEILTNL